MIDEWLKEDFGYYELTTLALGIEVKRGLRRSSYGRRE
jgi:hypothetical protein